MLEQGLIIKVVSDTFTVKVRDKEYDCKGRGKFRNDNLKPVVGDQVLVDIDKKVIEKIEERKCFLARPPVSNIDIALIVTSIKKPEINLSLLDRLISIVTINKIIPVIVFTKLDLASKEELKEIKNLAKYYEKIGIKVFNNRKIKKLKKYLKGTIVTVCGQTGAGKSTLINAFDKNLHLETDEISESLGRGKHTTRVVELFAVKDFYIVDTPGFSSIDINIYSKEEIRNSFKEFQKEECKFKDCTHEKEMGCQVLEKVNKGEILKSRYNNYLKFIKE